MTVLQYLCEFFFGNFWHFCGLVVVICLLVVIPVAAIAGVKEMNVVRIAKKDKDEKGGEE